MVSGFNFQDFVNKRIKLGKSQILSLIALGTVEISTAIQTITISLITPILQKQNSLTSMQVSILTSIFYLGVGLGALIGGLQSNYNGRRKAMIIASLIQFISSLLLIFNFSYSWLCMCRLLYGIGFGSTQAVTTVIVTELMSINLRGKSLLIMSFVNSIGKIMTIGLAFLFIEGENKQISQYMTVSTVINLLSLVLVYLFIKQSFRHLLFKKEFQCAIKTINSIILQNSRNQKQISLSEKQALIKWANTTFSEVNSIKSSFQLLFQRKRLVILLSFCSFFINFIFFGQMFIIPFMFQAKVNGLLRYLWMTLGQIPAILLTFTLIQRQGWGRRRSIIFFYAMAALLCFIGIQYFNSITLFFSKMFMKAIFQMLTPFTSQSYPTSIRSIGYAINTLFGRLGAMIMPFIIYPLYNEFPKSPFFFLSLLSILGTFITFGISQDTLQRPLDQADTFDYAQQKTSQLSKLNKQSIQST